MPESAGTFSEFRKSDRHCFYCGSTEQHYYRIWESKDGGFEDEQHECRACKKTWWVDGIDS